MTAMQMREIGTSGIEASAVGLGTWAIGGWMWGGTDEAASIAAIRASIDAGVTLIDTAPAYGLGRSEEIVGKAIAGRRDEVVLATKCGLVWHTERGRHFFDQDGTPVHRYLGPESILHELDASLRRLGTDHVDLYITHWQDPTTPIAETMAALEDLKRAGKIRAIGASNVGAADLEAYAAAGRLDAIQEQFSMVHRDIEAALVPLCTRHGISILSYSSLALGLLTGKIGPERISWATTCASAIPGSAPRTGAGRRPSPKKSGPSRRHMARPSPSWSSPGRSAAGHHLRALRGAQSGSGEGECARRRARARGGRPRPHHGGGHAPPRGIHA